MCKENTCQYCAHCYDERDARNDIFYRCTITKKIIGNIFRECRINQWEEAK
jgi:hypothetical protein